MAKILIVDDDTSIRTQLGLFVDSLGHAVRTAADADQALAALAQQPFDLVISDVRMPGRGGLGLLREMRERGLDVPVALMTAYAEVPQAVEAMRLGAYEYLMKPFSPNDVRLLIDRVIEVRQEPRARQGSSPEPSLVESTSLKELERKRIEEVLAESSTLGQAADRLGINPSTLWRKRRRYQLGDPERRRR